ncbi:MAG: hypothetical protein ACM3X3_03255 [Betaproteobacteria bacterium]
MGGSKTGVIRLGWVVACAVAVWWVCLSGGAMAAGGEDAGDGGILGAARLSGKFTLEVLSCRENSTNHGMKLDMAFDGKLRLPARGGMSCDITFGARPAPDGRGALGYAAAAFAAKMGGGLRLDLDARKSRTVESYDPSAQGRECISSTVRAALGWKPLASGLSANLVWERERAAYPARPESDHERRQVAGEVKVVPAPRVSVLAGFDVVSREYWVAPKKSSAMTASWVELAGERAEGLEGRVKIEQKRAAYPGSSGRTYDQRAREVALSWGPTARLSVDMALSDIDKRFPFAAAKNLHDREFSVSLGMKKTVFGTLTFEGVLFERKVPASPKSEYKARSVGVEAESPLNKNLSLCAGYTFAQRTYTDQGERDGDYREATVTWKLSYALSRDLDVVYEAEIKRREYPLKATKNTHRFESGITLVYRF